LILRRTENLPLFWWLEYNAQELYFVLRDWTGDALCSVNSFQIELQ